MGEIDQEEGFETLQHHLMRPWVQYRAGSRQKYSQSTLLQHVDASSEPRPLRGNVNRQQKACRRSSSPGYIVPSSKAQLRVPQVTCLGYNLEEGKQTRSHNHVSAIRQIPILPWRKQVWGFLGVAGYCQLWLMGFIKTGKVQQQVMQHLEGTLRLSRELPKPQKRP